MKEQDYFIKLFGSNVNSICYSEADIKTNVIFNFIKFGKAAQGTALLCSLGQFILCGGNLCLDIT